ncbi:MAG: phosphoadenosine phosphosulfate reductase family protein [Bacteroides sp.]|nr:phosphoadenosine phosphosulfate reductase family protein [Ruminococcus flavefaciens]MCM1554661.1 phosphoadenosine phosphosulfate reductase family protein [Bacteroides sp.]
MFKISWDNKTGGVALSNKIMPDSLGVSPRPVFFEELDLLGLNKKGYKYPHCQEPLMWACNKQYFYRGELMFEAKGANVYDSAQIVFQEGKQKASLKPVDVKSMLARCRDEMFLLETEAIEFIRDIYLQYVDAAKKVAAIKSNQLDFEVLAQKVAKVAKKKMAIVKQDCDSFDIMPLETAKEQGKRTYATTKIDVFLASFSGGKDSQVVLDLCTRAIPPQAFEVIYSDTGYELPSSLELYEEVRKHYQKLYPELSFRIARNHENVLNYWDKIGTPSDTHRWCCSVMKTAPLYRMLKVNGGNKQARVLAFEGTRGEESSRRFGYERIGKGVKHSNVINARPIHYWNTTEVFLYLLKYNIPFNQVYRIGKPRVGCLICPFSSEWDDMIVNTIYPKQLNPFLKRIEDWAKSRDIPNMEEYIKNHKWKIRASGKNMDIVKSVSFVQDKMQLKGKSSNASYPIETWFPVLGACVIDKKSKKTYKGELNIKNNIYPFEIEEKDKNLCEFTINGIADPILIGLLKRTIYKSVYCIQCEACEVECPTGALSVYPRIDIDSAKCIHCHKCLDFHTRGCIVADSLSMSENSNLKLANISGYGTFGLRDEWLSELFSTKEEFWGNNSLGKKQIPSFKAWLRDAGIIDPKGNFTKLGNFLASVYIDVPVLVYEIIWINLAYDSTLLKWFIENVENGATYSKQTLQAVYESQYHEGFTTFEYALGALFNFFATTPIGIEFNQQVESGKNEYKREAYQDLSRIAVAYSLYKYGEENGIKTFRVNDLYRPECKGGVYREFGIGKSQLEKQLRSLNSESNPVLTAELNMGLDHISLRDDLNAEKALEILLN